MKKFKQNISEVKISLNKANNYLTVKEFAEQYNIKVTTVYNWLRSKKIPHVKIVGSYRILVNELKIFINSRTVIPKN